MGSRAIVLMIWKARGTSYSANFGQSQFQYPGQVHRNLY